MASTQPWRVGVWQGRCHDGDLDRNLARAAEVVDEAAEAGCGFVCLPETFLSGYGTRDIVERGAMTIDDPRLLDLARRAADRGLTALVGLSEKRADGIWNTQAVLDGGRVAGVYTKTMLTGGDAEKMKFCCDDTLPVFEARGVRFAIQICHDSSYGEIAAAYAWKGARLLFSPHYNVIAVDKMDEHRIRVRANHAASATLNGLVVARSNVIVTAPVAPHEGCLGYGDSAIFSPMGQPLVEAGLFTERLVHADVGPWLDDQPRHHFRKNIRPALLNTLRQAAGDALYRGS